MIVYLLHGYSFLMHGQEGMADAAYTYLDDR